MLTHDIEDLGGGDGVKVWELVADLAPEHAARVQRDVTQPDQPGATGRPLKQARPEIILREKKIGIVFSDCTRQRHKKW